MKRVLSLLLTGLLLTGCGTNSAQSPDTVPTEAAASNPAQQITAATTEYVSRFDSVTEVVLSDDGIQVDGGSETKTVFTSHDIVYYEEKKFYESGICGFYMGVL